MRRNFCFKQNKYENIAQLPQRIIRMWSFSVKKKEGERERGRGRENKITLLRVIVEHSTKMVFLAPTSIFIVFHPVKDDKA
jgi:hypothetical protein